MATNRKKNPQLNQFFGEYVCTENLYLVFEDHDYTILKFNPLINNIGENVNLSPVQALTHCIIYCQYQHINSIRRNHYLTPEILYIYYPLTGKSLKFNVVTGSLETPGRKPRFKIPAKLKPVPMPGNEPV